MENKTKIGKEGNEKKKMLRKKKVFRKNLSKKNKKKKRNLGRKKICFINFCFCFISTLHQAFHFGCRQYLEITLNFYSSYNTV